MDHAERQGWLDALGVEGARAWLADTLDWRSAALEQSSAPALVLVELVRHLRRDTTLALVAPFRVPLLWSPARASSWALDCAGHALAQAADLLPRVEEALPGELRPRAALEAARAALERWSSREALEAADRAFDVGTAVRGTAVEAAGQAIASATAAAASASACAAATWGYDRRAAEVFATGSGGVDPVAAVAIDAADAAASARASEAESARAAEQSWQAERLWHYVTGRLEA